MVKHKTSSTAKHLRVQLIHSTAGRLPNHRACVTGLGLRRLRHTVVVEDTPAIRGMINQVAYLLKVETVS